MVTLTESAITAAKEALIEESPNVSGIRVGVVGGGCSGYSYALDFLDQGDEDEDDLVINLEGLKVCIDSHSAHLLTDVEIDYVSTLSRKGFVFNNPSASTTCGCGSSFS